MKRTSPLRALLACSLLGLTACASQVNYVNPDSVDTVNIDFGSTDLQMIASHEVDSLLAFPPVQRMIANGQRPILFVDRIRNKTMEHIDTESITDTIMTKLVQSGAFRFVDMTAATALRKQLDYQNNSGMVDPTKAMAMGQQIGAQYMLYGEIANITQQNSSERSVYYKFTLKLTSVRTGELIWIGEKQIRKIEKKPLFGL